MHNGENEFEEKIIEESAAETLETHGEALDEEANGILEASEEPAVTEEQLLELAKTEGLLDVVVDEEPPADPATPLEMSEQQQAEIMAGIETILFMSDKPVSLPRLRQTINSEIPIAAYRTLMARLRAEFSADHRGVEIAEMALGFQLRTKPQMAMILRKMVKTQPLRLTSATMEVLAVIAYKQPVPKDEIDQIRGVDSGYVLRNLMEKRLVRIAGRSELPGKPMLYGTTHEFLELFNMKDAKQLPPLHEVEAMVAASEVGFEEKSQRVMDEFGKMVASSEKFFDDSQIDTELEALRAEIASIPTSTPFIDRQKAKEKLDIRLADLATQGLTLDGEGNVVPLGSVPADAAYATLPPLETAPTTQPAAQIDAQNDAQIDTQTDSALEANLDLLELDAVTSMTTSTITSDSELAIQVSQATETADNEALDAIEASPKAETPPAEHQPSPELEADAAAAQWERHAAMIAEAVGESQLAVVNAEALADAVSEAKIEQELKELDAEHDL